MEEEEEYYGWLDDFDARLSLVTYKTITADSVVELLQQVEKYVKTLDIMNKAEKPISPLINFVLSNTPQFKAMKLGPTEGSKWKARLYFDAYIDMKNHIKLD